MSATRSRVKLSTDATVRTVIPPEVTRRHKRVFADTQEAAHAWAANRQPFGKNRADTVYFVRGVIYSYGRHFPAGRHVETMGKRPKRGRFITTRTYSSTPAGHMSDIRRAVRDHDGPTFYVRDVMASTVKEHRENFAEMRARVAKLLSQATRARKNGPQLLGEADSLVILANEYARFTGIADRIRYDEAADIAERAAAVKEQAERDRQRQEAADRVRLAEKITKWEGDRGAWLRGEGEAFPHHPLRDSADAERIYLRVSRTTAGRPVAVQTSLSARVPIAAAIPLLGTIRNTSPALAPGQLIGEFQLSAVDRKAQTVRIGCHTLTFAEIERIAAELGL